MPRYVLIFLAFLIVIVALEGCNTLYNAKTIDIEVVIPAKMRLPQKYNHVAVKYNNTNVSYNPNFSNYFEGDAIITDTTNIDSVASEIYFEMFVQSMEEQFYFDSVSVLEPSNYSGITIIDTTPDIQIVFDSVNNVLNDVCPSKVATKGLASLITAMQNKKGNKTKIIDPEYGLYSKSEIEQIADTTGADLFLSFDLFGSFDGINYNSYNNIGTETILSLSFWTIYDLQKKELQFFYDKMDTVFWTTEDLFISNPGNFKLVKKNLPERRDAILNAADISGTNFAKLIVPHWIPVQRMYYRSGNIELKSAEELLLKNEWMKAAEIYSKYTTNKNKSIAAKSMYNMAVICEIQGDLDAAIDWTVKSFQVFNQKNEIHYTNCMNYIKILGQRKLDIKTIELQLDPMAGIYKKSKNDQPFD